MKNKRSIFIVLTLAFFALTFSYVRASGGMEYLANISSSLTYGYILVGNSSDVATPNSSIFVASSGLVGIGTTTPAYTLDVYGTIGTNGSDLISIENNKSQAGGLYFDGITGNARVYHTLNQNIGTSDFSMYARVMVPTSNPGGNISILGMSSSSLTPFVATSSLMYITSAGILVTRIYGVTGSDAIRNEYSNFITNYSGKIVDLVMVRNATTPSMTLYINGIAQTPSISNSVTGTSPTWAGSVTSTYFLVSSSNVYTDRIYKAIIFNRALSTSDVQKLRERGISYVDQWGNLTGQTSGTLTVGKKYRITTFVAGDSFTNIGASSNATGVEFTTTGTTPTTWTNGSTLNEIGAVLDSNLENADPAKSLVVRDRSSNNFDGVVTATGVTQINKKIQIGNLFFGSTGNIGIGTTTPTNKLEVWNTTGASHFGGSCTTPGGGGGNAGYPGLEICGSDNTLNGIQVGVTNTNAGTSAYNCFYLNNDIADAAVTKYGAICQNSSTYTDTTFGTIFNQPNNLSMQSSIGPVTIVTSTSTTQAFINFGTGGSAAANERMRITSAGNIGIGTTSPTSLLQVTSSSATSTIACTSKSGTKGGRLILTDTNGTTCTEITTLAGAINSKAVTCP
jgi:hypothetical protein